MCRLMEAFYTHVRQQSRPPPLEAGRCLDGNGRNAQKQENKDSKQMTGDMIKGKTEAVIANYERLINDFTIAVDEKDIKIKQLSTEIEKLSKENEKLITENETLSAEMKHSARQRIETERRSKQLTTEMARITDIKGTFENSRDEHARSKLAERFQRLYSEDWVKLQMWIEETFPNITELQIIKHLTELMKRGYQECCAKADGQVRHFLQLDSEEAIPNTEEHQELFSLRKKYAMTVSKRWKMKWVVLGRLAPNDFFKGQNENAVKEKMKDFFDTYLECCWLMVASNPPMRLDFDVVGKAYNDCKEHFTIYSPQKPVEDMEKEENMVFEVVWPSVCLQDLSGYYKKGDVVIVKKGRKPNKTSEQCKDGGTNNGENESSQYPVTFTCNNKLQTLF